MHGVESAFDATNMFGGSDHNLLGINARNLLAMAKKRPLVLPAVLMLFCSFCSYYFASFVPAVILSILIIDLTLCFDAIASKS